MLEVCLLQYFCRRRRLTVCTGPVVSFAISTSDGTVSLAQLPNLAPASNVSFSDTPSSGYISAAVITYTPSTGYLGTANITIYIQRQTQQLTRVVSIAVNPLNAAPVLTGPSFWQCTGLPFTLSGLNLTDADVGTGYLNVTVTALYGGVHLSSTASLNGA